jgi:hypothetical protein
MNQLFSNLILSLFLYSLSINALQAQRGVFQGRVVSALDGSVIDQAQIMIRDEEGAIVNSTSTNFSGKYRSDSLLLGIYFFDLKAPGYKSQSRVAVRLQDVNAHISIQLERQMEKKADAKKNDKGGFSGIFTGALKAFTLAGGL